MAQATQPALDADDARQADEIIALFGQLEPDGTRRFSDEDVRHFLPMVIIYTGQETEPYPQLHALMRDFLRRVNAPDGCSAVEFVQAVNGYYRRFPPNRELEAVFYTYCRSLARGELDADKVRKYAKTAGLHLADQSPLKGMATTRPAAGLQLRRR